MGPKDIRARSRRVTKTEFHCFIQQRPPEAQEANLQSLPSAVVGNVSYLMVPESRRGMPLQVTFDEVYSRLQSFSRLFIEPDGSFVWVGSQVDGQWPWKLDGLLQDGGAALAYLELKGFCSPEQFDAILMTLGWPTEPLMFQLAREGITLAEMPFRERFLENA